eukprot:jgi/Botrbrau1/10970/Bobra.0383s0024.1
MLVKSGLFTAPELIMNPRLVKPHTLAIEYANRSCRHATGRIRAHQKWQPRSDRGYKAAFAASSSTSMGTTPILSKTEEMFKLLEEGRSSDVQAGGAGGRTTLEALRAADAAWERLRNMKEGEEAGPPPKFVQNAEGPLPGLVSYDVVVCGGTLGVFLACALQLRGFRVAVVERGPLKGREQEWNISRKELQELSEQGVLAEEEMDEVIGKEFNPVRCGFLGGKDVWTRDVLNLGVRPDRLIALVRRKFEDAGGIVYEFTGLKGVEVHPNGVLLQLDGTSSQPGRSSTGTISGRLLLDCMGNFSPIVQQARWGHKPDGVCLVVGSCGRGFPSNDTGDVIYTNTATQSPGAAVPDVQYFLEAFPAGSGPTDRTTYLFSYMDANPSRPKLESMLEDYWKLMPVYQGVDLKDIQPLRILFGFFPTYRKSPLKTSFDRILQVGDASGIQSPLSFGGFGALTRHLPRLSRGISEALRIDALDKEALASLNAYNPGLSGAWMLQRAMSVREGQQPNPMFINSLLGNNFKTMEFFGEPILKPFLQDVIQFGPLSVTLAGQMVTSPLLIPQIFEHVGAGPLLDWGRHYLALATYTALYSLVLPFAPGIAQKLAPRQRFLFRRQLEAWQFGAGLDYSL